MAKIFLVAAISLLRCPSGQCKLHIASVAVVQRIFCDSSLHIPSDLCMFLRRRWTLALYVLDTMANWVGQTVQFLIFRFAIKRGSARELQTGLTTFECRLKLHSRQYPQLSGWTARRTLRWQQSETTNKSWLAHPVYARTRSNGIAFCSSDILVRALDKDATFLRHFRRLLVGIRLDLHQVQLLPVICNLLAHLGHDHAPVVFRRYHGETAENPETVRTVSTTLKTTVLNWRMDLDIFWLSGNRETSKEPWQ